MAVRFLNGAISELCLGKPELTWIASDSTISDALTALKASGDAHVSVWECGGESGYDYCRCVGKFSVADVILFLCSEENLSDPEKAFESPVSDVLPKGLPIVRHLEPNSSLLEAIDCILDGTQNLVIPIQNHHIPNSKKFLNRQKNLSRACCHNGHSYCWLTQEDILRFLLNSVGLFSPFPSIQSLEIIQRDIMVVPYDKPASFALQYLRRALNEQMPIAVVDEDNRLIGEISPSTLACCDETAAAAITSLSVVDFLAYIDYGGPPDELVHLVKMKMQESNNDGMLGLIDEVFNSMLSSSSSSFCSSDDESVMSSRTDWSSRSRNYPARRSEAIVCSSRSSLVAVLLQALANRASCLWVVDEDQSLLGILSYAGMLEAFRDIALGRQD